MNMQMQICKRSLPKQSPFMAVNAEMKRERRRKKEKKTKYAAERSSGAVSEFVSSLLFNRHGTAAIGSELA